MSGGYVHGGTDPREVARLEKQAVFCSAFSMHGFTAPPGARVLDLATGVGATAGVLLARYPGIQLFGVDLNPNQLRAAKANHPEVRTVRANAGALPFPDGTFDRVFCTWLLEHVPAPAEILREVRRVLAPDGYCQFTEVDNSTFALTPPDEAISSVMDALNQAQQRAGGDPYVGKRVRALFTEAGFGRVESQSVELLGSERDPAFYRGLVEEFAEIFEGLDEALGDASLPKIQLAARRLRARLTQPGSAFRYSPVVTRAFR